MATFESIQAALSADSKLGAKVGGSLAFVLTGGQGGDSSWVVDCKQSKVSRGAGKADCTVTLSEENFLALVSGKLKGMQAFMSGKMKIKGNMSLAQKVELLFEAAKKIGSAEPPTTTAAAAPATAAAPSPAESAFQSTAVFHRIAANLKSDPSLMKKVGGVFHFNVTGGPGGSSAQWTVDAKKTGEVKPGVPPKSDCAITIGDADLVALATGKLQGMQAFMAGKMKIKGNMMLAQKFGALTGGAKSKL